MIGKGVSKSSATVRAILVLFLIVCLVNCATGSCLSYGHSCWGAHGKRSGKAPASAPDWYITRILRRMAASNEMNRAQNLAGPNEIDVYRVEDDVPSSNKFMTESEEVPVVVAARGAEAKPMLDDDMLSRLKIWQIIRAAAEEK
ncbi:neuropeptide CCHamide-1 isoform X2 [Nymphalis io]|uniref:neuropeptide CCHamide-1 isoform X2 n=1 Tax=Inachis io TaxID=171585 RepID=UPI00216949A0|nr:neuropeptide CCHamide-1 isoform X2 [Nymphalis io]